MEKVKVNLVVKGDIISNGCISARVVGGYEPSLLSKVENLDDYDISQAIIIDGNLICDNLIYTGTVIATGYVAAKSCGG
ncbi:hypothetical protein [uncultured phage cr106_1]|uniref:Uncharacterized protein n=1 Tax=uncultured phage cr106_1 TaxID=2772062 RepID=A0A7M1RV27_9CAUD|nr:hypothetical protein KNV29_gp009 [uncultured phage cr106_1]QOR58263.1 hypothetical protein [uncultured phage cr106_1]